MKNKSNKLAGIILAFFVVIAFTSTKAQCPSLKNDLTCGITIDVYEYTSLGVLCAGPTAMSVPAFGNVTLPCTCGGPTPIIEVVVTTAGGAGVGNPSAITSPATPPPGTPFFPPSTCGAFGAANIYFDNSANYHFEVNR